MAELEAELAKTEEEKCASASSASEYEKTSQSSTGSVAFHGAADAGGDGHKLSVVDCRALSKKGKLGYAVAEKRVLVKFKCLNLVW
uniref:Uncharacterized protein n=1 Tax=Oryza glumipatula TaxID=40148 RepID=A0A0E0A1C9_9ORYZ